MTDALHDRLDHLLALVTDMGSPVAQHLLPPLTRGEIATVMSDVDLHPCEELVSMYTWRNGVAWDGWPAADLFREVQPAPLAAAVDVYRLQQEPPTGEFWPTAALPAFLLDPQEVVAIGTDGADANSLWWWSLEDTSPVRLFDTVADAVDVTIFCIESGLYVYRDSAIQWRDADTDVWGGWRPPGIS